MTATSKQVRDDGPGEIEALLPWHANGTLSLREARRVEAELMRDPALARQYAVIQDERAETIHLNESLGAPSSRPMQALFAAIDAEPARSSQVTPSFTARIVQMFASLSPRTLAYSAAVGAVLVLLQAGVIGTFMVKGEGGNYRTASVQDARTQAGVIVLVRFVPEARMSEISTLLGTYHASIVDGPKAGLFRVQIGDKTMSNDEITRLLAQIQSEKIVGFVAAAD
jgi:hypothetical protein